MKIRTSLLIILMALFAFDSYSQAKSDKPSKEELKAQKQKQTEDLVNSKVFVFTGRNAFPSGARTVNLTSNTNFLKFSPDMIESQMPFFGQAYNAGYGSDGGYDFKGKPDVYTVKKGKKNFDIYVEVADAVDKYRINLSVSFSGSASLTISSNRRSQMNYNGEISSGENSGKK